MASLPNKLIFLAPSISVPEFPASRFSKTIAFTESQAELVSSINSRNKVPSVDVTQSLC